jgi:hypothetical protein
VSSLNELKGCPVFVHSLFRAGSTYIFSVFRRSTSGYWCFQEPMSEFVLSVRNNRESMLAADNDLAKVLRHPDVRESYYSELYSVSDECINKLEESCIYDGYFATTPEHAGVPYLSSLISSAQGRPFIQECRTSSRIGVIKKALGGCHIYLWRNPWDQWWSYKVDHYFDDASQMCINGSNHPEVITRLIDEIGFNGLVEGSVFQKFSWFFRRRLSPDNSYLVFYVLWFLGLKEGVAQSELQINIDRLSDSLEYRNQIMAALEEHGVDGLDFSDCLAPQAVYGAKDREFFQRVEERAHALLLLSGVSQYLIDEVIALRKISEPLIWHSDVKLENCSSLIRDAERARELVLLYEQRGVDARISYDQQLLVENERYTTAEAKLIALDAQVKASEAKNVELEAGRVKLEAMLAATGAQVATSEARCVELEGKRVELEAILVASDVEVAMSEAKRAELEGKLASKEVEVEHAMLESKMLAAEIERQTQELLASTSWRLTSPLRFFSRLIKKQGTNLSASPLLKIKHRLKCFISHLIRAAIANSIIKGWAVSFLSRRPVLKARLKRLAWGIQQNKSSASSPSIATVELPSSSKQSLSLKRKGNGDELKSPLESFFY